MFCVFNFQLKIKGGVQICVEELLLYLDKFSILFSFMLDQNWTKGGQICVDELFLCLHKFSIISSFLGWIEIG